MNTSTTAEPIMQTTLIEFPGVARSKQQPQWRRDLSERVRVIQERRAQEVNHVETRTTGKRASIAASVEASEAGVPRLVPHVEPAPVNPIVAAALRRIERARESAAMMPVSRSIGRSNGSAATAMAVAHVSDVAEEAEQNVNTALAIVPEAVAAPPSETKKESNGTDPVIKTHKLVAIPAHPIIKNEAPVEAAAIETKPAVEIQLDTRSRRVISEVVDDALIAKREAEQEAARSATVPSEIFDDQAPLAARSVAAVVDLLIVAFVASPFAAIIELTSGNWGDWRVAASMVGIVTLVLFLYSAAAIALAGRTWGMSLVSLFVVDVKTGLPPTLAQAVKRAFFFLLSIVTLGLGALYSLFDAERRALHDHLSDTIVVRD
ncbi:MAG: RDD family protein [Pyrinomonadaceae bacterium]|nr:RDD family protein [Pyrinomonadaceae bacterium]